LDSFISFPPSAVISRSIFGPNKYYLIAVHSNLVFGFNFGSLLWGFLFQIRLLPPFAVDTLLGRLPYRGPSPLFSFGSHALP
jgi:hypothetical protein